MSLDPKILKKGDIVRFGNLIIKEVRWVNKGNPSIVRFSDGHVLDFDDLLWRLAELGKPALPHKLHIAKLTSHGFYELIENDGSYTPEYLLQLLKLDIAALVVAGVEVIGVGGAE